MEKLPTNTQESDDKSGKLAESIKEMPGFQVITIRHRDEHEDNSHNLYVPSNFNLDEARKQFDERLNTSLIPDSIGREKGPMYFDLFRTWLLRNGTAKETRTDKEIEDTERIQREYGIPKWPEGTEVSSKTNILSVDYGDKSPALLQVPEGFNAKKAHDAYMIEKDNVDKYDEFREIDNFRDWLLKKGIAREININNFEEYSVD